MVEYTVHCIGSMSFGIQFTLNKGLCEIKGFIELIQSIVLWQEATGKFTSSNFFERICLPYSIIVYLWDFFDIETICFGQIWLYPHLYFLSSSLSVFPFSSNILFFFTFFPFYFFLLPNWQHCALLFLTPCFSHNAPGQGWSISYITSVTQRGTVTATKSLCMVIWREVIDQCMLVMLPLCTWTWVLKHANHSHSHSTHALNTYRQIHTADMTFSFLPKPPVLKSQCICSSLPLRPVIAVGMLDLSLLWLSSSV